MARRRRARVGFEGFELSSEEVELLDHARCCCLCLLRGMSTAGAAHTSADMDPPTFVSNCAECVWCWMSGAHCFKKLSNPTSSDLL